MSVACVYMCVHVMVCVCIYGGLVKLRIWWSGEIHACNNVMRVCVQWMFSVAV